MKAGQYVLVATKSRRWSVVAGEFVRREGDVVTLKNARMIVYYSVGAHGLIGAAALGPGDKAKVSPSVDELDIENIELVATCSCEARTAIEAEPWT